MPESHNALTTAHRRFALRRSAPEAQTREEDLLNFQTWPEIELEIKRRTPVDPEQG